MVDTTPYNRAHPLFTKDKILKILLGGVDAKLDGLSNDDFKDATICEHAIL